MAKRFSFKKFIGKLVLTVLGLLVVCVILYPITVPILSSLVRGQVLVSTPEEAAKFGLSLEHYIQAVTNPQFVSATITSVIVAVMNIVLSILIITPAAYAFSRFKFFGKDTILVLYLIFSQVGGGFGIAAVIALYVFLLRLNALGIPLIGNPFILPVIYTATAVPFQTWLIKNYFDSMPRSLDEAAFMDGANWRQIIFKVILPASKAAMIIIAMFAFMGAWGEFILASFLRVQTLAAYIYQTASGQTIYWSDFAARTILFAIPIIIIYAVAQKYIGEAMRYGSGKF